MPVKEATPSSRRSARLAPTSTPASKDVKEIKGNGKKRGAEVDKETNKKSKLDSKPSKTKSNVEIELKSSKRKEVDEVEKVEEKEEKKKPKSSSNSKLQKGDTLPSIKLENEDGEEVDVSQLTQGGKGVVIFVYPKADTPGCTNQACGFRDHLSEIKKAGYEIYGLSKDKPAALKRWKIKKELNYTLLSDPESKLIKRLGAFIAPNNSCRSHFIFDKDQGKLVDIAIKVKPADDPKNCLAFIKNLHA